MTAGPQHSRRHDESGTANECFAAPTLGARGPIAAVDIFALTSTRYWKTTDYRELGLELALEREIAATEQTHRIKAGTVKSEADARKHAHDDRGKQARGQITSKNPPCSSTDYLESRKSTVDRTQEEKREWERHHEKERNKLRDRIERDRDRDCDREYDRDRMIHPRGETDGSDWIRRPSDESRCPPNAVRRPSDGFRRDPNDKSHFAFWRGPSVEDYDPPVRRYSDELLGARRADVEWNSRREYEIQRPRSNDTRPYNRHF